MKIADTIEIYNGSERITALASGDAALEISGSGAARCRIGRITAGGFSESIALPEKLRCHRTNDNLCAEFDTLNVIPFGCEYRVKRHWTLFNNIALLSCDIAADNGGTIRTLELEPVEFPFAPAKVEFLIFGEKTLHSVDAPEGELYCGSEVPLLLRVYSASGDAAEYVCGDDIWRHRAAGKIPGAEAQFKITASASGVILERKIFDIPEETAVEKRPWKFKSIFSWSNATPAAAISADAEKITVPGCFSAAPAHREIRKAVRRTGANVTLLLSGEFPRVCSDPVHLERSGKAPIEHSDLGSAAADFLWANRELAKRGSSLLMTAASELYGNSIVLSNLARPLTAFVEED